MSSCISHACQCPEAMAAKAHSRLAALECLTCSAQRLPIIDADITTCSASRALRRRFPRAHFSSEQLVRPVIGAAPAATRHCFTATATHCDFLRNTAVSQHENARRS